MVAPVLQYPPRIHCTNCREDRRWEEVKKSYAADGRYLIICQKCDMTIKFMEKFEADWNKKVYGIIGCEEEYGQVAAIIPQAYQGQPGQPPAGVLTPPSQVQSQPQTAIVPPPVPEANARSTPAIPTTPPADTATSQEAGVIGEGANPKEKSNAGKLTLGDIKEARRLLTEQINIINKQLQQLVKAEEELKPK